MNHWPLHALQPLRGAELAPTISSILANPAEVARGTDTPFYAYREAKFDGRKSAHHIGIIATTETEALQDFTRKMSAAEAVLSTSTDTQSLRAAERAGHLRNGLRYMSQHKRAIAAKGIASHLIKRLDTSEAGELFIGVESGKSSILIYDEVMQEVTAKNSDAAAAMHPLALGQRITSYRINNHPHITRLQRAGVLLLDDWTVSGDRMAAQLSSFIRETNITPDKLGVIVMSASDEHLRQGVESVEVRARYRHPFIRNPYKTDEVSLGGTHGSVDYGNATSVDEVQKQLSLEGVRSAGEHAFPLIYKPASPYNPDRQTAPRIGPPEAFAALDEQIARCNSVEARLLRVYDDAGNWPK